MAVLRKSHKSNYTVIDNGVFKSCLSLKSRGLLCTMLSLPDSWHFSERGLQSILPADGQTAIHSAIKELESSGYLTRERLRDDKGKVTEWVWTFSDYVQENQNQENKKPQVTASRQSDFPDVENPDVDSPDMDSPDVGNLRQLSKEEVSTEEERKQESSKKGCPPPPATPEKRTYGEFGNVLLSDDDLTKLQVKFPDWKERIERLSSYMASKGKRYKNHRATIENWARRDSENQKPAPSAKVGGSSRPTPEEIMEKHGVSYITAQGMLFDGTY